MEGMNPSPLKGVNYNKNKKEWRPEEPRGLAYTLRIMGSQNYRGLEIPKPCFTDLNPSFSEGPMILRVLDFPSAPQKKHLYNISHYGKALFLMIQPGIINIWNPQRWKFGSDDVRLQFHGF